MKTAWLAAALAATGCQLVLGIEDPEGAACELRGTDCPPGSACDVDRDTDLPACRPVGTAPVGGACADVVDCPAGTTCLDAVCRTLCFSGDDSVCDAAAGESSCLYPSVGFRTCDSACDPQTAGSCGGGRDCAILFNLDGVLTTVCVPETYFGGLGAGEPCTDLPQCRPGLACFDPDSDGTGTCVTLCRSGEMCPDTSACPGNLGGVRGVTYGLCSS